MFRCKASEVLRNAAYLAVGRGEEYKNHAADRLF